MHADQFELTSLQVRGLRCVTQLRAAGRALSILCDALDRRNGGRLASAQLLCLQSMAKCTLPVLTSTQCACRSQVYMRQGSVQRRAAHASQATPRQAGRGCNAMSTLRLAWCASLLRGPCFHASSVPQKASTSCVLLAANMTGEGGFAKALKFPAQADWHGAPNKRQCQWP